MNEEGGNPVTQVEGGKKVKLESSLSPTLVVPPIVGLASGLMLCYELRG